MEPSTLPTIFVSYSRRQLYFAEAVALHLQQAGLNIWFDLQQLKAGQVWADGLKEGIGKANTLVLVVSRAALASPWVADEWKSVAQKGNPVVLAICESVELPEELQGLPTYDFRKNFKRKIQALIAYFKGEAEPHYDKVPKPSLVRDLFKTPSIVLLIVLVYLTTPLLWIMTYSLSPGLKGIFIFLTILPSVFALGAAIRYGSSFFRHRQFYKKVRRSIMFANVWLVVQILLFTLLYFVEFFVSLITFMRGDSLDDIVAPSVFGLLLLTTIITILFNVFVYYRLGRSKKLLRWMQPDDDLQNLRRYAHQPLLKQTLAEIGTDDGVEQGKKEQGSVRYTIHNDPADQPLSRWIAGVFKRTGHQQVKPEDNPDYHIAVLSNRTSLAKVQALTHSYAGKLIFVVASTIEFTDDLKETGRYQWVDIRNIDKGDIIGLASSLGNEIAGKVAGLEATPSKIDSWHTPAGLRLLRGTLVIFSIICFVTIINRFGDALLGNSSRPQDTIDYLSLVFFGLVGISNFWLIMKGLVRRKLTALTMYGGVLLNFVVIYLMMPWEESPKMFLAFSLLTLLLIALSVIKGRIWFPASAKPNQDEIGISDSIISSYRKRYFLIAAAVLVVYGGLIVLSVLEGGS